MSDKKEEIGDAERPQRPRRDGQGRREDRPHSPQSRTPQRDGDRPSRSDRAPREGYKRDGKPREAADRKSFGDRKPYGDRKSSGDRPRRSGPPRGDRPSYSPREGERREYKPRGEDKREWKPRESGGRREYRPRGEDKREWKPRDGGPRKQYGDRPRPNERGERDERPELTPEQLRSRELRMVRPRHDDPAIDPDVTSSMLDRVALNEMKTLTKENAEFCAEHLVMAARLIETNPELAHQHALSASRRGGRIGVIRETLAITAYASGDFALALRELRTFRRISGSNEQIALMVDSERGIGRPDRALELGRSVDRHTLSNETQVALAIAMSGARLDLNQVDLALAELEIPQLDPKMAFSYSPALFRAYAEVLEELGRHAEAADWIGCAEIAERALAESNADVDTEEDDIVVFEEEVPAEVDVFEEEVPVDLDVLEEDVRQILEETAHLDKKSSESASEQSGTGE